MIRLDGFPLDIEKDGNGERKALWLQQWTLGIHNTSSASAFQLFIRHFGQDLTPALRWLLKRGGRNFFKKLIH